MSKKTLAAISATIYIVLSFNSNAQQASTQNQLTNSPQEKIQNSENKKFGKKPESGKMESKNQKNDEVKNLAESNASCKNILEQCKKLGFVSGGFKEGNGLWRNCFFPTVNGKGATQKGSAISVSVSPDEILTCKSALPQEKIQKMERKMANGGADQNGNSKMPNKENRQKRIENQKQSN